jgi:NADPH:quinone reductase-like Zn-dependent oxidoreductase
MFAVYAEKFSSDDPLTGLVLGERPDPEVPDGWTTITVKAAALNHHDLWSLRGVGLREEALPMTLGCDAAGVDEDGRDVVVHAVISGPDWTGDETLDPKRSLLSERYQGTFADRVAVPRSNVVPKPASLSFEEAACLPTAWLTAYRMLFTQGGLKAGDTVLVQGAGGGVATALIALARAGGLTVFATSRDEGKRARALELGAHHVVETGERLPVLVPLGPLIASRRQDRHLRHHVRTEGRRRRADPDLLPAAAGDRLDHGDPCRAGLPDQPARRDRDAAADRPGAADGPGARRLRGDGRRRRLRQDRLHAVTRHLITGAGSGIGAAVADLLHERGDDLVLLARSERRAAELAERYGGAETIVADLADPTSLVTVDVPETLDSLLHVAGVVDLAPIREVSPPDLREQVDVNLVAPVLLTRACLPALRRAQGLVVFVNSSAGLVASPGWGAYAASKFGLRAVADALRAEELDHGVRVTTVFPSRTATPMQEKVHDQEGRVYDAARWIRPETVADTIRHVLDLDPGATIPEVSVRPVVPRPGT